MTVAPSGTDTTAEPDGMNNVPAPKPGDPKWLGARGSTTSAICWPVPRLKPSNLPPGVASQTVPAAIIGGFDPGSPTSPLMSGLTLNDGVAPPLTWTATKDDEHGTYTLELVAS